LGVNNKTVDAVDFARAVKFQFSDCNVGYTVFTLNEEGICGSLPLVLGCMDENACNYDPEATEDDQTCFSIGDACDDGDDLTLNDVIDENCECVGEVDPSGLNEVDVNFSWGPNPANQWMFVRADRAIHQLKLLNGLGQVVVHQQPNSHFHTLNLEGMKPAFYVMQCLIDDQWVSRKVLIH
jgi:hypothetical protein